MTDYYVWFGTGDNSNSGTVDWANAWATLEKAVHDNAPLAPGDTIHVRARADGDMQYDYFDTSRGTPPVSGTASNPIRVIGEDPNNRPTITGSIAVAEGDWNGTLPDDPKTYYNTTSSETFSAYEIVNGVWTKLARAASAALPLALGTFYWGDVDVSGSVAQRFIYRPTDDDISGKIVRRQAAKGAYILKQDYWHIENLEVGYSKSNGITIRGDHCSLKNCSAWRCWTGVHVGLAQQNPASAVDGCVVDGAHVERNRNGIWTSGNHQDVVIRNSTAKNNGNAEDGWDESDRANIAIGAGNATNEESNNTLVENCHSIAGGGFVGPDWNVCDPNIIIYRARNATVRGCTSTGGIRDGFMVGIASENCVVEYCKVYQNGVVASPAYWPLPDSKGQGIRGFSINKSGNCTIRGCDVYENWSNKGDPYGINQEWRAGGLDIRDVNSTFDEVENQTVTIENNYIYGSRHLDDAGNEGTVGTYDLVVYNSSGTHNWNPPQEKQIGVSRPQQIDVLSVDGDNDLYDGQDDVNVYMRFAGNAVGTVFWGGQAQTVKSWSDDLIVIGPVDATGVTEGQADSFVVNLPTLPSWSAISPIVDTDLNFPQDVDLSAYCTGSPTLTYELTEGEGVVNGSTLTISDRQFPGAYTYTVTAFNDVAPAPTGVPTQFSVTVTGTNPIITADPESATVAADTDHTFTGTATHDKADITYSWIEAPSDFVNGTPTANSLEITPVVEADDQKTATLRAEVYGGANAADSVPATLTLQTVVDRDFTIGAKPESAWRGWESTYGDLVPPEPWTKLFTDAGTPYLTLERNTMITEGSSVTMTSTTPGTPTALVFYRHNSLHYRYLASGATATLWSDYMIANVDTTIVLQLDEDLKPE